LGTRISEDTFTCKTPVLNFIIHQQSHKIAEVVILHHPPKLYQPACILLQIKLTDVPASSMCLNSRYPKAKHTTIITISSTTLRGPWPPQKNSIKSQKDHSP
jgi:hypothetical protein